MLKQAFRFCIPGFRSILIVFLGVSLLPGCSKMDISRIRYNPGKQVYEYPLPGMRPVVLRTNDGKLVTNENFEQFIVELSLMGYRYPFDDRSELAGSPRQEDYQVAELYAESVVHLKGEEFDEAIGTIQKLEEVYPEVTYYSDVAFLKGYAREGQQHHDEAKQNYDAFLSYSAGKFPERFRNHRYADPGNRFWLLQRDYAKKFIDGLSPVKNPEFLQEIVPAYAFTSFQPGYTMNPESRAEKRRGMLSISLGTDLSSDLSGGVQYYRHLTGGLDINPEFSISRNMWELRLALPVQVYRSDHNRFGLKVSPFGHYSRINTYRTAGTAIDVGESVFNYGIKTSAGFYIVQKLSLGAYYTWNYYNAGRPYNRNENLPDMWWDNEYDVSLYVPLIKGLNLKGGIKSGDWVAGFYLPGWEISYNFNEGNIILRTEMY